MAEDTQQAIADDLGVSRRLVGYAIEELEDSDVNLGKRSELTTDEKREQVREFKEMLAIEQERAKERQKELGEQKGGDVPSGNVTRRGDEGLAREKAAEKVNAGVSGRTLEKAPQHPPDPKGRCNYIHVN